MKRFHFLFAMAVYFTAIVSLNSCAKEAQVDRAKSDKVADVRSGPTLPSCTGALYGWCDGPAILSPGIVSVLSSTYNSTTNECCVVLKTFPFTRVTLKVANPNPAIVTPVVYSSITDASGNTPPICFTSVGGCILVQILYNGVLSCIELDNPCD